MVTLILEPHVEGSNDLYPRYMGVAINQPLPSLFWQKTGYTVGTFSGTCFSAPKTVDLPAGSRNYIIVGTSADAGYKQTIRIRIKSYPSGAVIASTPVSGVDRNNYAYLVFTVTSYNTVTMDSYGLIAPGTAPATGGGGGGGGQDTSGGGGTTGLDPEKVKEMMEKMMNTMMPMVMAMAMMQMMVGMMQSLAGGLAGAF